MTNNRPDYRGNPLDLIGALADVAGGLGNWIANGTPSPGSIPGEIQQRYRDHCDAWSNGPTWVQQIDPGARLFLSNACAPWLGSQGSGDPGVSVPFTGGQCPVRYSVETVTSFDVVNCVSGDSSPSGPTTIERAGCSGTPRIYGPLTPRITEIQGDCGLQRVDYRLDGFDFDGTPVTLNLSYGSSSAGRRIENVSFELNVTRCDGQPDDCGDPEGEPAPNPNPRPDPGLDPEDEPFEREPGRPVLPMPEIPDPFGDPVQLPNFPVPRIDGPSLYPEDQPPLAEPGEPGDPETIGGDGEAEGEAADGELLTGVLVEVDSAPGFARTVQNVTEPTYIGACYVYLGWDGQLDLQPEGQFLVSGQFFAAVPGMTHWRVRSAVGYTLTITPYYVQEE